MTLPEDSPRNTAVAPEAAPEDATPEALQREPLHFIVVVLLLADIVFGLGLAVFAEKMLNFRPMALVGCLSPCRTMLNSAVQPPCPAP